MTSSSLNFSLIENGDTMILIDIFKDSASNKPQISDLVMVDFTKNTTIKEIIHLLITKYDRILKIRKIKQQDVILK